MRASPEQDQILRADLLLNRKESSPLSSGLHMTGENTNKSWSRPPRLTGNWEEQEEAKQGETEVDFRVQEIMERVKYYIRSIDISNL
jgi:hypothetical protein